MPTCVVKSCKHYMYKLKKSHGITYHAFPRNKHRRDEWISVIRNCRKESDWEPSFASTVCSAHFDDDDFIITPKGLRCLVPFAVPTRFLSDPQETQATLLQVTPDVTDEQPSSSTSSMPAVLQAPAFTDVFVLTNYCRLCASSNLDSMSVDIQSENGLKNIVMNMSIRLNTNIDFNHEHLPTTICSACVKALYTAYDFVVGIDMAQMTLNKISMQKYKYQIKEYFNLGKNKDISSTTLQQVTPKLETIEMESDFSSTPLLQVKPKMEAEECESDSSSTSMVSPKIEATENETELSSIFLLQKPEGAEKIVSPKTEAAESDVEQSLPLATDSDQQRTHDSSTATFVPQPSLNPGAATSNLEKPFLYSEIYSLPFTKYGRLTLVDKLNKKKKTIETQRRNVKSLNQKVRRLVMRNELLKKKLKEKSQLYNNVIAADLFNNINRKLRKKNMKYSQEFKKFCVMLHSYSTRAYKYVRKSLDDCLPHQKSVASWYGLIEDTRTGVEENPSPCASASEAQEQKESV